jgi:hypothetical protein
MTRRNRQDLGSLLDGVEQAGQGERISVGDIVARSGRDGIVPVVLLVALAAVTPLSGIPGVSIACGLMIALASAQLLVKADCLWLPGRLRRLSLERARVARNLDRIRPVADWLDRHTHERLRVLFHRPLVYVPETLMLLAGLTMPFLEVIPFSSSAMAAGVALLSLALLTRDGLFAVLAVLPFAGLGTLLWVVLA